MTDVIQLSPGQLREMAGNCNKAAEDISTKINHLRNIADKLINNISFLKLSPEALQQVCNKWYEAAGSQEDFLYEVGVSLNNVADNFQDVDKNAIPPVNP